MVMTDDPMEFKPTTFSGQATIKIRFNNNPEYVKFRTYVLKTKWNPGDSYPLWEEMTLDFHCVDDLDQVTRIVVMLLQLGFEVYSCRYKLEQQLAEEEHPTDEDISEEETEQDFDLKKFCSDLRRHFWKDGDI